MVISITSFPARLPHISACLQSVVDQADPSDHIVLWLGKEKFPRKFDEIPEDIQKFSTRSGGRIDFRFVKDVRSFTKLIPAVQAFPEEAIITLDDDVIYAPGTLARLKAAHERKPKVIFAHGVSDIYQVHGTWKRTTGMFGFLYAPMFLRMPLGIGGVLYPPHSLHAVLTDESKFRSLCPTTDDIWFWYCATKQGTPIQRAPRAIRRPQFASWSVIGALCMTNETDGDRVNLENLKRLLECDNDVRKTVETAYRKNRIAILFSRLHRLFVHYPRQVLYCLRCGGVKFFWSQLKTCHN